MEKTSKKWKLNKEDLTKLGKGFLIAMGGTAIVYIGELFASIDFGGFTPLAVGLSAFLINFGRKLHAGK